MGNNDSLAYTDILENSVISNILATLGKEPYTRVYDRCPHIYGYTVYIH